MTQQSVSIPERAREDKINELIAKYGMSPDSGLAQASTRCY